MITVNIFAFLWRVIILLSFRSAIDYYAKRYNNYLLSFGFLKIYVIKDRDTIKTVMGSNPSASFLNRNFSCAHGMIHTIDLVESTTREWSVIHKAVKSSITDLISNINNLNTSNISPIDLLNQMFEEAIRTSFPKRINFLTLTDNVIRRWFYEVFVGFKSDESEKSNDYWDIRRDLLQELHHSFYNNRFRWVPILGSYTAKIWNKNNNHRIEWLQVRMSNFLDLTVDVYPNSFYGRFRHHIRKNVEQLYPELNNEQKFNLINTIFVNNSLLSILTYDFVHSMIIGCVLKISEMNWKCIDYMDDNADHIGDIYRSNFLFRYRGRKLTQDVQIENYIMSKGSIIIINLLDSEMFYSSGERSCVGQGLARPLIKSFYNSLKSMNFVVTNYTIDINSDPDIPIVDMLRSDVTGYIFHRDQLRKSNIIPSNTVNGVKLYNLWHLYSNPDLKQMIQDWSLYIKIKVLKLDPKTCKTVIIVPEARGLPFATMISHNEPIIVMTKDDKFGPTIKKDYNRGYNTEIKTIHIYKSLFDEIKKYDYIVFVDDGFASGGTIGAFFEILHNDLELFEQMRDRIRIVGIINHTYIESKQHFDLITMFDL